MLPACYGGHTHLRDPSILMPRTGDEPRRAIDLRLTVVVDYLLDEEFPIRIGLYTHDLKPLPFRAREKARIGMARQKPLPASVGVLELGFRHLLSWVWPEEAHAASALRLVLEFPGIAGISYVATRFHRSAALVLGGMMLLVAILMTTIGTETLSRTYVVAFLTVGPLAALLGGLLHRGRERMAS